MSEHEITEPPQARPWRPSDGPEPTVATWPPGRRPALWVWAGGSWRHGSVQSRQEWADGRVFYQVAVDLRGDTAVTTRLYQWPHEGLRTAHGSDAQPSTGMEMERGDMPRMRPRRAANGLRT